MKKCKCKSTCTPSKAGWKLQSLRKFLKKKKGTVIKSKNSTREIFERTLKTLNENADRANVRFASRKPSENYNKQVKPN